MRSEERYRALVEASGQFIWTNSPNGRREREQRRSMAALQHARNELQRVFEQAPAAKATIEMPSLVFRSANERYRPLLGGRDVAGKHVLDALPELHEQPFFIEMSNDVARTATPYVGHAVPAVIDGGDGERRERWFDFVCQPLTDPGGVVMGIMVHAIEVGQPKN